MRKLFLAVPFMLALSACGGSAIVDACVKEGESKAACACMDKTLKAELSPTMYKGMSLAASGKEAEAEALMKDVPPEEGMKMMGVMVNIATKCEISGRGF